MKVLKSGTENKTAWTGMLSCTGNGNGGGGCGAHLLVEEGDVFQTTHRCFDGSTNLYATFLCPECGVLSDINEFPYTHSLNNKEAASEARRLVQIDRLRFQRGRADAEFGRPPGESWRAYLAGYDAGRKEDK